jgi:flagellar motor switch protein FliM
VAEILTKDEIEALLAAVSTGEIAVAAPVRSANSSRDVKVYDFLRPTPVSPRQRSILHAVHDRLCRQLSRALTAHLNMSVEVKVGNLEALAYRDFEPTLPNPSTLVVFNLEAHRTRALLAIHPLLGFIIADRMMGGQGAPSSVTRPFTEIEQDLIDEVVGLVQVEIQNAWDRVLPTGIQVEGRASGSQFIQFVPGEEVVVAFSLEVRIEQATGLIQLCYASRVLDTVAQVSPAEGQQQSGPEAQKSRQQVEGMVNSLPVEMTASMGPVPLRVREVLSLREGDVLLLNHRVGEPLDLAIGKKVRFKGYLGVYHEKLMFAVSHKL